MYSALLNFAGEYIENDDSEELSKSNVSQQNRLAQAGGITIMNCTVGKKTSRAQFFVPSVREVHEVLSVLAGMGGDAGKFKRR